MFFALSKNNETAFDWYSLAKVKKEDNDTLLVIPYEKQISGAEEYSITKTDAPSLCQTSPFQLNESQKKSAYSKAEYCEMVGQAIGLINEAQLQKLVLSRTLEIPFTGDFPLLEILLKLKQSNPNTYVYAYKKKHEIWLGASPETFINYKDNSYLSFALAGTIAHQNKIKSREWTAKEQEEQRIVAAYIFDVFLKHFGDKAAQGETKELFTSNLCHLLTEVEAKGEYDDQLINRLLNALHPTPAVCGFPTNIAKAKISTIENHDRELYSGIFVLKQNCTINSFVNLRCMRVSNNKITLFAGGGITADSDPEMEWFETEHKLNSTLKILISLSN